MIKYVFSDFFGVLASEVAPVWLPRHMSKEEAISYKAEVVGKVDEGEILYPELLEILSAKTGVPAQQIGREWYDLSYPHDDFIAYLRALKSKYGICLLSNASSMFLRSLLDKHHLNDLFDEVFISAEIRLIKPHADYFEYALKRLHAKPEECVFIDDNVTNCEGARSVGIHAVVYKNAKQVAHDLLELGVTL